MEQIINSLLETDLYKFSMGQAIYHQFPSYTTTWTFRCRNTDVRFTPEMVEEIKDGYREIIKEFDDKVDLIVDAGILPPSLPSTIIDISTGKPQLVRQGQLRVEL